MLRVGAQISSPVGCFANTGIHKEKRRLVRRSISGPTALPEAFKMFLQPQI
jgi:hypothetical protein